MAERKTSPKKTRGPQRGSPRVAAWISEVLNPLRDSIQVEIGFLESGNTTWRYHHGRPEYLRPLEEYLAPEARFIFRDFVQANADGRKQFLQHDELFEALVTAAALAYNTLMNQGVFVDRVRERLAEFRGAPLEPGYPGGAIPEEDFPKLVAERVVNEIQDVLPHYSDAEFWERYHTELLTFGQGPEFQNLRASCAALLKQDRNLHGWLAKNSFRLCEKYYVPAARLPGWSRATRTVGSA